MRRRVGFSRSSSGWETAAGVVSRVRVVVIGCGHVGLPTGLAFALTGHSVAFVDSSRATLDRAAAGQSPSREPGVVEALRATGSRVSFEADLERALPGAEVALVAVGTPLAAGSPGGVSVADIERVVRDLARATRVPAPVVALKSTVPPGTSRSVSDRLQALRPDLAWAVAANPEFLRMGQALPDALRPSRIVIGTESGEAWSRLRGLYRDIARGDFVWPAFLSAPRPAGPVPVVWTDPESAEVSKLAANTFLAARVSLVNEVANVCDLVGADVADVARIVGLDSRVGPDFLEAGLGYGGSCLPKDVALFAHFAKKAGHHLAVAQAIAVVNDAQRSVVLEKLERLLGGGGVGGVRVALLGLAFKPGTDDDRGSLGWALVADLVARGASVSAHDPVVRPQDGEPAEGLRPTVKTCATPEEALTGADGAILATAWAEYVDLDWGHVARLMRRPVLVDGRNALDPGRMAALGFTYAGVGRGRAPRPRVPTGIVAAGPGAEEGPGHGGE